MVNNINEMEYVPEMPTQKKDIVIIGAGGIVKGSHLPAYKLAGFNVIGIYNRTKEKAQELADEFEIPNVFDNLDDAIALGAKYDAVYDIALPASLSASVLRQLPKNSGVLIQKPMGESIEQAKEILDICREKNFTAGINFQMRQAPYIIAAKKLIDEGVIGEINDMEVRLTVYTPWHLWDFLFGLERMEINYHSIHYIDLIRYFLGDPKSVYCKTMKHPKMPELAQTKSTIILDYGDYVRANISTNHGHEYGIDNQECFVKIEGDKGAIKIRVGVYFDYPKGIADKFEYISLEDGKGWRELDIKGSWFSEAFIGTMGGLMKKMEDPTYVYINDVEDAYKTMLTVEAAYESNASGGTVVKYEKDFALS